ncbi:MAG: protein translocase subunit SecD [Gammaproteobacteria bacterium]|nr:protein translocase subunit SecD [Gammaproteobacteria bacterium]MCP5136838.1 protein translocase subunit SecD [Gammaproteobacteria bacterium]
MNHYPWWKTALIVLAMLLGTLYALPNLYGEDPAIQISPARDAEVNAAIQTQVEATLSEAGLKIVGSELSPHRLLVRFTNTEDQLKAADLVKDTLGRPYIVALNLAPATPAWLQDMGGLPMYLGLDLRGGVHFLMEVDMDAALSQAEERYVDDVRLALRNEKVRYLSVARDDRDGGVVVSFRDPAELTDAQRVLDKEFGDLQIAAIETGRGTALRLSIGETEAKQIRDFALQQNITTLRNRVNELGVAEPVIQQQGDNRIVVQLPGVQDTARAKDILGATATLEFRMADEKHDPVDAEQSGRIPAGTRLYHDRDGRPQLLKKQVMLTGEYIVDAASGIEQQNGSPAVFITLSGEGGKKFANQTRDRIGLPMAVVFIENKVETKVVDGEPVKEKHTIEEVISVATIRDQLGKRFQITGIDSTDEARDLALLLRAGSLAAPIEIIEERTVGPSLGQDNIDQGFLSVVVGMALVLVFMALYYKVFGLVANVALAMNLVLIVAVLSMFQATLTLPGIAGIVLTIGMAVDANVLIYERIREELRIGNSPQASIHAGYAKAFSTIADANITTLIAAVVLFSFGTGPIKGFAITLSIGIVTSMFTAIMGTRALINLIYGGKRVRKLLI